MCRRHFRDLLYDGRREAVRNTASFKLCTKKKNKLRYVVRVLYIKYTLNNVQTTVKINKKRNTQEDVAARRAEQLRRGVKSASIMIECEVYRTLISGGKCTSTRLAKLKIESKTRLHC